jgi:predicted nucleic acid-binding protein
MILLDTDIIIAHLKGDPRVTERILSHLPDIAIPAIVLAEFDFGAKASARAAENLERLYAFVRAVPVVSFHTGCAR